MSDCFYNNIQALNKIHPKLVISLQSSKIPAFPFRESKQFPEQMEIQYKGVWVPWSYSTDITLPKKKGHLLLGAGCGSWCLKILQSTNTKIVVWDENLSRIKSFLENCDISSYIEKGRCKIIFGSEILLFTTALHTVDYSILPMLSTDNSYFLKWFLGKEHRDVYLVGDGGLYVEDVCSFILSQGHSPLKISLEQWQLQYAIKWKPKAIITINFVEGLELFCEQNKIPYICWEIDPNMDAMDKFVSQSRFYRYTHLFTYRKKHLSFYQRQGITTEYLPLAAPIYRKETASQKAYVQNLVFVGSSMYKQGNESLIKLQALLEQKLPPLQVQTLIQNAIQYQQRYPDTYVLDDFFHKNLPLYKAWFPEDNIPMLVGEYCASQRRLEYCRHVAPFGLDIWGDSGWKKIDGCGANIRGEVGYFRQINQVYSSGVIHLDINRLYQNDMITLRVFEVLACGGFILAEYSEALKELFELGTDIETWKNKEELVDKIKFYLHNPTSRDTIRRSGQNIVLQKHRFSQKMHYIFQQSNVHI